MIHHIDGIPVPEYLYEAARQLAIKTNKVQQIGVEYYGNHGEDFFNSWASGKQCRWLLGYTRDELQQNFRPWGIIHVAPQAERVSQ
jgi:hypothetical protein